MPEEIEIEIENLKKKYPEFFKDSAGVLEFALSERTFSQIADICIKNGVGEEEKIEGIAYRITLVLLGKLPKKNLAITLEQGLGLNSEIAQKISNEADHLIFSQAPSAKTEEPTMPPGPPSLKKEGETVKEKPPSKPDTYREPVE